MKKLLLVPVLILLFLFIFGCTDSDQKQLEEQSYYALHPCPKLPCNDLNNFNKVIRDTLGFSALEYTAECMECAFPYESIRGSYTKARLDVNGEKVSVYYKEGLCSKLGVDCGWEVCISTEKDKNTVLISQIKEKFCPLLKSEIVDLNNLSCKNEVLYDTNTVIERCNNGYYETSDELGTIFSVSQSNTQCGYSIQRGKMDCMK